MKNASRFLFRRSHDQHLAALLLLLPYLDYAQFNYELKQNDVIDRRAHARQPSFPSNVSHQLEVSYAVDLSINCLKVSGASRLEGTGSVL